MKIKIQNLTRKFTPIKIKIIRRKLISLVLVSRIYTKQKIRKYLNYFLLSDKNGYTFAILCIKRIVYVDMVIDNINSLHFHNHNHEIIIYCDSICAEYLHSKKSKFNYLRQVIIKNICGVATKPWQYYKVDAVIEASRQNAILIDADGIWHEDPVIKRDVITLLVLAHKISDNLEEKQLITYEFGMAEWVNFNHYVTGFISIPSRFMNEKLANDMRIYNNKIFTSPLNFIDNNESKHRLRRLSEEIAINLALQSNFFKEEISTLKNEDGPGSKKSLQSLYYGCCNNVNE